MKCPLLYDIQNIVAFCDDFKEDTIKSYFTDTSKKVLEEARTIWYYFTPRYREYWENLNDTVSVCSLLGIESLDDQQSDMIERMKLLGSSSDIENRSCFEGHLNYVKKCFEIAEEQVREKLQLLEEEEIKRLNEALRCYLEECNYATVAMSVSAIEFRLFSLMKSQCPKEKLEELTLGQLIREYLSNKEKYGSIIPEKHELLLQHCNVYRIFSVHPKKEKITKAIATSIINMTFAFLLDKNVPSRPPK